MGVPIHVVAAKKRGEWVIRAIAPLTTHDELRQKVEQFVGRLDDSIEWTHATYFLPAYLYYGDGEIEPMPVEQGIYRFPATGEDHYRDSEWIGHVW